MSDCVETQLDHACHALDRVIVGKLDITHTRTALHELSLMISQPEQANLVIKTLFERGYCTGATELGNMLNVNAAEIGEAVATN